MLEGIQTLLALSSSGEDVKSWYREGAYISHLDHRMYFYSIPQLAGEAVKCLYELSNMVDELTECVKRDDSDSLIDSIMFADITPNEIIAEVSCVRSFSKEMHQLVVADNYSDRSLIDSNERLLWPHPFP